MSEQNLAFYKDLWDAYMRICNLPVLSFFLNPDTILFPSITENSLSFLLTDALEIFKQEEVLLKIEAPIFVVGDLHGHLIDLFRIFTLHGKPDKQKYLFLGDIVDRGEFSMETIIFVLLAKILYPQNVFIIRGNHEFDQMGEQFGFMNEILERYRNMASYNLFNRVFSYIPMAAVINKKYLCLHGGIGPTMFSMNQIESIQRPIVNFDSQLEASILWSDPSLAIRTFKQSSRGIGYLYGEDSTESFLKETGMEAIIRGHECVMGGIQYLFNKKVVTVFSASDYCGITGNSSGVLEIDQSGTFVPHISPPIPYLYKRNVKFIQIKRKIVSVSSSPTFDSQHTSRALPQLNDSPLKNQKTVILSKDRPHIKIMKLNGRNTSTKIRNNPSKRQIPKSNSFNEGLNHLSKK